MATNSESKCFISISHSYHFKVSYMSWIVLHSPAIPTQKLFPDGIFWLFIFAWNLWRPISWFGVATQTCLGGMCPTVGTGLAHRVSGLWHVLRLAGPQQLLHLLDEQDFPDSGWKAQDKACQC